MLLIAGFFSTGCSVLCSHQVGVGNKEEANEAFNLAAFLTLGCAVLIIVLGVLFPTGLLRICGVPLNKHPELHPHMYAYLKGYWLGIPAMMLLQIMGPILILDNGKKLFAFTTAVLCAVDIAGDLLNVFPFLHLDRIGKDTGGHRFIYMRTAGNKDLYDCIRCKGIPRFWHDVMFLPKGFGGDKKDNMYAAIHNKEDVSRVSKETQDFCLQHGVDARSSGLIGLFVEEMSVNVLEYAESVKKRDVYVDFRLFAKDGNICFSMMDLSDHFDPTLFYELNKADYPKEHLGIGIVMKKAKEVRYFSAFNSNNLIVMVPVTVTEM